MCLLAYLNCIPIEHNIVVPEVKIPFFSIEVMFKSHNVVTIHGWSMTASTELDRSNHDFP